MDLSDAVETNETPDDASRSASSDNQHDAHLFGRNIALAMACMDAAQRLQQTKAAATEHSDGATLDDSKPELSTAELSAQLHRISAQIDVHRAELIALLVKFDEQKGWAESGARQCADWGNAHLGIAKSSIYEFLRVGRELRKLPVIHALFRGGELSWSKTKLLTRVADADNERELAHVALSATVSDVERICREFRWPKKAAETGDPDTDRTAADLQAEQQFNNRSFTWHERSDGSIQISLTLPPEKAQIVLKSVEQCDNELYEPPTTDDVDEVKPTATQRRADAMVLVAERSLQYAGNELRRSDRYQVVLHIDMQDFTASPSPDKPYPSKVPWVEGLGPIADSVAQRMSCDASLVSIVTQDGEPLTVGRQTRVWPTAISRAIMSRDRHCQFPGCTEHRYLEIHHIKHWADQGETSVDNGICLCQRHHSLVHECGYTIERNTVKTNTDVGSKDFGTTMGFVSRSNNALLPTRHRFRFIKPVSQNKPSGCCENECHEAHPVYLHSQRQSKSFVATCRNSKPRSYHNMSAKVSTWRQPPTEYCAYRAV